jgi:phosphoribosylaminoimidazolecarboxamide formyltransferase/IMP cyclohydrolase
MGFDGEKLEVVTETVPADDVMQSLLFAWKAVKHVKSNGILLAQKTAAGNCVVGVGAGQMSRIDSTEIAGRKAGGRAAGSVLASDAFFPFRDCVDAAAELGVRAIIQPGGSVRDRESIEAANEKDLPMVFTGRRHFRH